MMHPVHARAWLALAAAAAIGLAGRPAAAGACNVNVAGSPAASADITLTGADLFDGADDQLRSFVETGSLGRVEARLVSASPRGAVIAVNARPALSHFSPYYGEQLRGIDIAVALAKGYRSARVRVRVSQVCARHFRNTFLYF
jgi:hypothetical protein